MNPISSFSLSLQKQIKNQSVCIDTELNRAFRELKFRSLLKRSGITKHKGYAAEKGLPTLPDDIAKA